MNTNPNLQTPKLDADALDAQIIGYSVEDEAGLSDVVTAERPVIHTVDYAHIRFRLDEYAIIEMDKRSLEAFQPLFESDPRYTAHVLDISEIGDGKFMLSLDDKE